MQTRGLTYVHRYIHVSRAGRIEFDFCEIIAPDDDDDQGTPAENWRSND